MNIDLQDLLTDPPPPSGAPLIKVEGLSKRYGKLKALDKVSFEVYPGAIFGFVGPNGAGKTTTIKILATLLAPSEGWATIAGYDVERQAARVRDVIGYMPDFFGVYDDLTVLEYLDFYASTQGVKSRNREKLLHDLLALVDLESKRNVYVESLSRGMKQRLCLARCLVHDPKVLLLDEPASGLDPRARVEMRELLKELQRMGKTILISSHILPELAELCTEIGIVDHGRFIVGGTVEEVQRRCGRKPLLRVRLLAPDPIVRSQTEQLALTCNLLNFRTGTKAQVNLARGEVLTEFSGSDQDLRLLLAALIKEDLPLIGFNLEYSSLEEIFLDLTTQMKAEE
jgi:ABC-2 type transport system ATP-binding protein